MEKYSILIQFIPMIVVLILFYIVMMLPEKKRRKKYDEMLNSLKVNDKVMTRGGVIGKIITLDDDSIILESGPNKARLRFTKQAIANKLDEETKKKKA
ncbi:MAG: preprotein translocase subunit YajC [Clostridium sp.]|nr:preprotein translocase subunit YajC [Clostridium sp.]